MQRGYSRTLEHNGSVTMARPYDAGAVANWFLDLGHPLDPMKLQKLVYFAHGWNLALTDEPLIDEPVQAWSYGPVIPSLYHEFKHHGSGTITDRATVFERRDGKLWFVKPRIDSDDSFTERLLQKIWELYGSLNGVRLSAITHAPNSPWTQVRAEQGEGRNVVIPNDVIREYFQRLARRQPHAGSDSGSA